MDKLSKKELIALLLDMPEILLLRNDRIYKVGDYLVPLSINIIRKKYQDPLTKKYLKIEHFAPQSNADRLRILEILPRSQNGYVVKVIEEYNDPNKQKKMESKYPEQMIHVLHPQYFMPNGDLIIKDRDGKKIEKAWLQRNGSGPYHAENQRKPFYYIDGKLDEPGWKAQVCSGPLNVVSYDCLDSITMWVLEDKNN